MDHANESQEKIQETQEYPQLELDWRWGRTLSVYAAVEPQMLNFHEERLRNDDERKSRLTRRHSFVSMRPCLLCVWHLRRPTSSCLSAEDSLSFSARSLTAFDFNWPIKTQIFLFIFFPVFEKIAWGCQWAELTNWLFQTLLCKICLNIYKQLIASLPRQWTQFVNVHIRQVYTGHQDFTETIPRFTMTSSFVLPSNSTLYMCPCTVGPLAEDWI